MRLYLRSAKARFHPQKILRTALPPTITATADSDTSITVAWTFNDVSNADQIEIERSLSSGTGFAVVATETANGSGSKQFTSLTAGTTYYFRARGLISSGAYTPYSEYGNEDSATTTGAATPDQPTNFTATETARDDTTVTYTLACTAVSGATSYDWYVGPSTDSGYSNADATTPNNVVGATFSQPNIPFTRSSADNEASPNVRARNASGPGPWATISGGPGVVVPGNLGAPVFNSAIVSGTSVIITYTEDDEADAADQYKIERSDNDGSSYSVIATKAAGTAAPQYTDTGLASDDYLYRVRAHDTDLDAYSNYSAIKSATVGGAPPEGYFVGKDFTTMTSLADLNVGVSNGSFSVSNAQNILFDDGSFVCAHTGQASGHVGLIYRFLDIADRPGHAVCADHSLTTVCQFGGTGGFLEVWIESTIRFSSNWTTANDACPTFNPDYKTILTFPLPSVSGNQRSDFRIGNALNKILCYGMGGTSLSTGVPKNVYTTSVPVNATTLWDEQPHVCRVHLKLEQDAGQSNQWEDVVQCMIDGQVTQSFRGRSNQNLGTSRYKRCSLGANRNMAAPEEMYVWWHSFYVYTSDPGWFTGVAITDYT
jgi:hypothetical protein